MLVAGYDGRKMCCASILEESIVVISQEDPIVLQEKLAC
jgi:hypothetical protein